MIVSSVTVPLVLSLGARWLVKSLITNWKVRLCLSSIAKLYVGQGHSWFVYADGKPILFIRGLYFGPKTIFIPPPPLLKMIFFPPTRHVVFYSHWGFYALILPYFAFILPFYFPFSHFLLYFPPFSLRLFIFFPQISSADISPPQGGGGVFSNI